MLQFLSIKRSSDKTVEFCREISPNQLSERDCSSSVLHIFATKDIITKQPESRPNDGAPCLVSAFRN